METKLLVPFHSQYEISNREWNTRSCGMASLAMVIEFLGSPRVDLFSLVEEGREKGGYQLNIGWKHDYFLQKAKEEGFVGVREEKMNIEEGVLKLQSALEKGVAPIVSGRKRFFGEERASHLVVLTGFGGEGKDFYFLYHDPEMLDEHRGAYRKVSLSDFKNDWRKMAIFLSK
ncbi:MAG: papain-like cysteine protease family protein [Patescibacteria group bacterium]